MVVAVAIIVAAASGCDGGSRPAPRPPTTPSPTPTPVASAAPKPWPTEPSTWKGLWGATTPKSSRVVWVRDALGLRPGDSSLGLVVDGRYQPFASAGRDRAGPFKGLLRQIYSIGVGQGYVVWAETPSTDLDGEEWTIRAWRQSTGQVTEIAHSRYLRAGHRYIGYAGVITPVALNGRAFWPSAVPTSDHPDNGNPHDWSFQIRSAPLSGGGPVRSVATDAAFAAVTSGSLFYATHSSRHGKHVGYVIHRRVGGAGRDLVLARGTIGGTADLTNLAAGNGMVAWTVSSPDSPHQWRDRKSTPGRVYLLDLASGRLVQIVTGDDAGANYSMAFGPDRFLWDNGSGNGDAGQYVYNLADQAIYRLWVSRGGAVVVSAPTGPYIRWSKFCPSEGHLMLGCEMSAGWRP